MPFSQCVKTFVWQAIAFLSRPTNSLTADFLIFPVHMMSAQHLSDLLVSSKVVYHLRTSWVHQTTILLSP